MIKFGLIGGTSWHSTIDYYAEINRAINALHGDNTNPELLIASLNQREIHNLQRANDWDGILKIFRSAALELQGAGVSGIAICANTPHKIYGPLQTSLRVPILHIADAIGDSIRREGWQTVGLLGTRFTMEEEFIRGRLRDQHGIKTLVPPDEERQEIQDYFYQGLSVGDFAAEIRDRFLQIIGGLIAQGCQAVILGCTEFPILLKDARCSVQLINSTECHCDAIVRHIVGSARTAHEI